MRTADLTRVAMGLAALLAGVTVAQAADSRTGRSWAADDDNGTYSNPLFYDEFSDPNMIRLDPDYPDRHHHAYHARAVDPPFPGPIAADHPGPAPRSQRLFLFQVARGAEISVRWTVKLPKGK